MLVYNKNILQIILQLPIKQSKNVSPSKFNVIEVIHLLPAQFFNRFKCVTSDA